MARKNTSKPAQPMKKSRGLTKTADDFENVSSIDTSYSVQGIKATNKLDKQHINYNC